MPKNAQLLAKIIDLKSLILNSLFVAADPNVTVNHNYIFYVLFREINYLYKYILVLYTLLAMISTLLNFAA